MDHGRLPPREPGELEISAPVRVPHAPLPARTRLLLAAVALLLVASLLGVTVPAAQRGLAAARAQATQTAATIHQVRAAQATETTFVRHAIAAQTAAAQATAGAAATIAAASTTAYRAAVPGCPLGDPLWQTQNFDPVNPNFVCSADGLQILTGARPHFGVIFCAGCSLATRHDTQIHIFDIQPNVATVDFNDGVVMLTQHMDGSWELYGPHGPIASGTYSLPGEFTVRIRYDGSHVTVTVNDVIYAALPLDFNAASVAGTTIDFVSRDYTQPSAISVRDFAFTPLP
ncbi:MAG TPA: hypothetical protein VID73_07615 [Ktedonobacterales bacterium]